MVGTKKLNTTVFEGVLLQPAPAFAETLPGDVFGALPCKGKPKAIAEMDAGVLAEARHRHKRL